MAEYTRVEKPFLDKLRELNWQVIDQGQGIPSEPRKSLRNSFTETILTDIFKNCVRKLNLTPDGQEWLTDKQLNGIVKDLTVQPGIGLFEANKKIFGMLTKGITIDINEVTGKRNVPVKLIDYVNWSDNSFIAINQFLIPTPHTQRKAIIPDIVLFVNGLPVIVVECKDEDVVQPMSEALTQIQRYANLRDDDYGTVEGEEKLFYTNFFNIITHGKEARFGTISADFEFFLNWKDIFPESYKIIEITPEEQRQEVMIHGLLNREILIDVMKHFTLFMNVSDGREIKTVCRYQQYRAVRKIIDQMKNGNKATERSGVVWHTQGSGKSLTMVFLVKKLRSEPKLRHYKVVMIVDRTDLETQLKETAILTGEEPKIIENRKQLSRLGGDLNNLNLVMIHKFSEDGKVSAPSLIDARIVPTFKHFSVVNEREEMLMLIDEAHRTQGGDMGDNLFSAFPNATRIGFTGTPLLTERHKIKTHDRFGEFIDTYEFDKAVADGATVPLFYVGRTSNDKIDDKELFDTKFEDMFKDQTLEAKQEIQKRYGGMVQYLESKERIQKISADIVEHYVREVLVEGFKAMVVASSIIAAVRYSIEIKKVIEKRLQDEENADNPDMELINKLKILEVAAIVSSTGNNEEGYITAARKKSENGNAIVNFKRNFNGDKPETGMGLLCVCDRLLTGFDAPIAKVMYLDKNLREHDLLQAIARVNRTKKGKTNGLIVDYFGITRNLQKALDIYTSDKEAIASLSAYFRDLNKELPVLETRFKRVLNVFGDRGVKEIQDFVYQRISNKTEEFEIAEKCVEMAKDVKVRAEFDTYLKSYFDTLEMLFNVREVEQYWIPTKRLGYLHWRIQNRYRDATMDLKWASAKVRKLIDTHLKSMGIDEKVKAVSILSDDFPKITEQLNGNNRAIASEMEHAMRYHIKVKLDTDPALYTKFKEKLDRIIQSFQDNWDLMKQELERLRQEMDLGRNGVTSSVPATVAPYYDFIIKELNLAETNSSMMEQIIEFSLKCVATMNTAFNINNFWDKSSELKKLEGNLEDLFMFSQIEGLKDKGAFFTSEFIKIAKARR